MLSANAQATCNTFIKEHFISSPYISAPHDFYASCIKTKNSILLESAEMLQKRGTQSLLGLNCAVKVICHENLVKLYALNNNGLALLEHLPLDLLADSIQVTHFPTTVISQDLNQESSHGNLVLTLKFMPNHEFCDEATRLKQANPLDVLRLIQQYVKSTSHILFTGVIAFDFINTFEHVVDSTVLEQGSNCVPDLSFYLYDLSLVIDHVHLTTTVCSYAFSQDAQVQNELKQRSAHLNQLIAKYVSTDTNKIQDKALSEDSLSNIALSENSLSNRALSEDGLQHSNLTKANLILSKHELMHKVSVDIADQDFAQIVRELKEHIAQGDIFQVVPSRTFSLPCHNVDLSFAYLKQNNPSPYMFCLKDPDFTLFGASPEFALRFDATTREVAISPIAGTRPRGRVRNADGSLGQIDPLLDERLELELRLDHKEVAEHIMLVDLARNDLARIAKPVSRHTENLLHVDKYQSVMHLVSDVKATLRDDLDALHAYISSMNMGTLSGAPKLMAHQLIYKVGVQGGFTC